MKLVGTIALALLVIIASLLFISSSICMVGSGLNRNGSISGGAIVAGIFALCCLGIIVGGIFLIARIHRQP